jgi:cytochrome P450
MVTVDPAATTARPGLPTPPGVRLPVWLQTVLFGQFRPVLVPMLRRRYGNVFTIRVAPTNRKLVMLADPADIKTVFAGASTTYHAGEGNAILGTVMGTHSVLLVDEEQHRRARRLLMPAFHGAALRGYQDLVTRLARAEVERWPVGRTFRAHDRMNAVTLEIILQVVFGVTDPARLDALRPLVRRITDIGVVIMLGWFYKGLRRYGIWRRYMEIQIELDRLLYAEIAQRRQAPDLAERTDVLSRLLHTADEDPLTDAELRDQLVTLLLAGHETTASALAWTLAELARRPEQLRAAQRAADDGDEEYLTAVVKETLRLRPVIFEIMRKVTEPIDIGGYRIAAGSFVSPSIGLVQSDPANHDAPDDFRPERFLAAQPAPNTWIPFGGGIRRCLGAGFSLMEATAVLREVLVRYDIRPDHIRPERQKARNITLVPARGARISIKTRNADAF